MSALASARNMITRQRALLARTNVLGARMRALETMMSARQAIARSQALRNQLSSRRLPYDPTAYYPTTTTTSYRSLPLIDRSM